MSGLIWPQIRKISTQLRLQQRNHYDSLGISAKATQADVKSAYYKLSMIYHPDKNKDCEDAVKKFRDINEAYEVLGNVKSRKLYDRGLYMGQSPTMHYEEPLDKFYKSRETKHRPPTPYGRTTVYDFDEWSRTHYGATFRKDIRYREMQRFRAKMAKRNAEDIKSEKVIFLIGFLVLLSLFLFVDQDHDRIENFNIFGSTDARVKRKISPDA